MSDPPSPPPIRQLFAHNLKWFRLTRGFATARKFAQSLGIDENRYTRYERAEVEPDLSLLSKICVALDIRPNDLLGGYHGTANGADGFAETADPPPAPADSERSPTSPARMLAWQLASEIAGLAQQPATAGMKRMAGIAEILVEIEADPFAFVTRLPTDPRLANIDGAAADRIAGLAERMMAAISASALPPH